MDLGSGHPGLLIATVLLLSKAMATSLSSCWARGQLTFLGTGYL